MLPKLSCSRAIQVIAIHPHPDTVDDLALLELRLGLGRGQVMEVEICGNPDGQASVQPSSVLLPSSRWHTVDTQDDVSLSEFDRLPSCNEGVGRRVLREMHGDRIDFRLLLVIA
jgi:hypothetical protein